MAAAAFKANLIMAFDNGERISYLCTVSDVNGQYYTFQDGNTDVILPTNKGNARLVDVMLTPAYGTDTTTADIYINGRNTPYTIQNAANQASNLARQFISAPLGPIAPGARLRFIQKT